MAPTVMVQSQAADDDIDVIIDIRKCLEPLDHVKLSEKDEIKAVEKSKLLLTMLKVRTQATGEPVVFGDSRVLIKSEDPDLLYVLCSHVLLFFQAGLLAETYGCELKEPMRCSDPREAILTFRGVAANTTVAALVFAKLNGQNARNGVANQSAHDSSA